MAAPDHHVKSVATAFRIVEALDRGGQMGVTEIASEAGITKSSAYKHLDTLRHCGYVTKGEEGYALSYRWFGTGRRIRERETVYRLARPEVDRLARRTGETVSLVVEEDGDAVYVYQTGGTDGPAGPIAEGERIPAPLSVGGKAIYSYRPLEEARSLVDAGDLDLDPEGLADELRSLRDQRLVVETGDRTDDGVSAGAVEGHRHVADGTEPYRDLHAIAVPVRTADDYGVAALEVTGAPESLSGRRLEEDIAELLVAAGRSVETDLVRQR